MNTLDFLDAKSLRNDIPEFRAGDTLNVHVKVIEGSKERVQVFKGVVIRRQGGGVRETFTVRKISFGVGVERTFPVHSPNLAQIEVVTRGDVRRAKLYYLRELRGKKARIKERRVDDAKLAAMEEAAALAAAEVAEAMAEEAGEPADEGEEHAGDVSEAGDWQRAAMGCELVDRGSSSSAIRSGWSCCSSQSSLPISRSSSTSDGRTPYVARLKR